MPDPIDNKTTGNNPKPPPKTKAIPMDQPVPPPGELKEHAHFSSTRYSVGYQLISVNGSFEHVLRFDIRGIKPLNLFGKHLFFKPKMGQAYPPVKLIKPEIADLPQPVVIVPILAGGAAINGDFQYINVGVSLEISTLDILATYYDFRLQANRVNGEFQLSGGVNFGARIRLLGKPFIMGYFEYAPTLAEWGLSDDDDAWCTPYSSCDGAGEFFDKIKNAFDAHSVSVGLRTRPEQLRGATMSAGYDRASVNDADLNIVNLNFGIAQKSKRLVSVTYPELKFGIGMDENFYSGGIGSRLKFGIPNSIALYLEPTLNVVRLNGKTKASANIGLGLEVMTFIPHLTLFGKYIPAGLEWGLDDDETKNFTDPYSLSGGLQLAF